MDDKAASVLNRLIDLIPLIAAAALGAVASTTDGNTRTALLSIASACVGWAVPTIRDMRKKPE